MQVRLPRPARPSTVTNGLETAAAAECRSGYNGCGRRMSRPLRRKTDGRIAAAQHRIAAALHSRSTA